MRIGRQEDAIRRTITALTDLESEAAAHLWDIEATLEIADNHLHVHGNAVDRAARLWDALASHLPVERRGSLARLSASVELMHQTLIQVVSDVDRILTEVEATVVALDTEATALQLRFAHEFSEATVDGHGPISQSLSATGHFTTVRRRARELSGRATRTAASYRNLLDAIGHSFNERRVRENDVLHKAGALLAAVVAMFGLISAGGLVFDARMELAGHHRLWVWIPVGLVSAVLLSALGGWASAYRGIGKLGSFRYRFTYRRLMRFLRLTSTSRLEHLTARLEQATAGETATDSELPTVSDAAAVADRSHTAAWREHDEQLAREYAHVWDLIDLLPGDERVVESAASAERPVDQREAQWWAWEWWTRWRARRRLVRADRRQLQRMVEKWSLRTLLFAERPREMYRYHLVKLTLLYRAAFPLLGRRRHVVSTTDLRFVLQCWPRQALRSEGVALVLRWLDAEAAAICRAYEVGPTPDHTQPPDRGWLAHLALRVSAAARLIRQDHRDPRDGRASRLLAAVEEVGLQTGFGGHFQDGERREDGREVVLDRIEKRLQGRDSGPGQPPTLPSRG